MKPLRAGRLVPARWGRGQAEGSPSGRSTDGEAQDSERAPGLGLDLTLTYPAFGGSLPSVFCVR